MIVPEGARHIAAWAGLVTVGTRFTHLTPSIWHGADELRTAERAPRQRFTPVAPTVGSAFAARFQQGILYRLDVVLNFSGKMLRVINGRLV